MDIYKFGIIACTFCFGLLCFFNEVYGNENLSSHQKHHSKYWDFLMLVQEWPPNVCDYLNVTHKHRCKIPDVTKSWTLHGLWPTDSHGGYPQYCSHKKFNVSKVEDLHSQLEKYWPNLFFGQPDDSLWKHEFEKHGTCAANVSLFDNEHKYFQQTILMRLKYDLEATLRKHNIVPTVDEGYHIADIKAALNEEFGSNTCPGCSYHPKIGQVLSQAYICMDKELRLIDCKGCEKPCRSSEPVYYRPFHVTAV